MLWIKTLLTYVLYICLGIRESVDSRDESATSKDIFFRLR